MDSLLILAGADAGRIALARCPLTPRTVQECAGLWPRCRQKELVSGCRGFNPTKSRRSHDSPGCDLFAHNAIRYTAKAGVFT